MEFNHIHFIINPAAGKEEPILSMINKALDDSEIDWDISVTKKDRNAGKIAQSVIGKTDLIAVYGGDGSVTEVAVALYKSNIPMAIIPGGTANVMAKELGIPLEAIAALEFIKNGKYTVQAVDMGLLNEKPFLLRINMGIMADMVLNTDRKSKDHFGQFAYGITAIKTVSNAIPIKYSIEIDGEVMQDSGVSLTVTNSGNIGIGDYVLHPGISIIDGMLDIILLNHADLSSLLKIAGSTMLHTKTEAVKHWKCNNAVIRMENEQRIICDDSEMSLSEMNIRVEPGAIRFVVPVNA